MTHGPNKNPSRGRTTQSYRHFRRRSSMGSSLPVPSDEALQADLDRETDPKAKNMKLADLVDLSVLREIEKSGFLARTLRQRRRRALKFNLHLPRMV